MKIYLIYSQRVHCEPLNLQINYFKTTRDLRGQV